MQHSLRRCRKSTLTAVGLGVAALLASGCQSFSAQPVVDHSQPAQDVQFAEQQPVLYPARFSIRVRSGDIGALVPEDLDLQLQPLLGQIDHWHQVTRVMVVGHTDAEGSEKSNLLLSLRRANAVAEKLVDFGVPEGVLEVDGRGEAVPIAANNSISGKKLNRRVEIIAEGLVERDAGRRVGSRD